MTEMVETPCAVGTAEKVEQRLKRRYAAEKRFQAYGIVAIVVAMSFLAIMLVSIVSKGWTAFLQTQIQLEVVLDPQTLGIDGELTPAALTAANYGAVVKKAMRDRFPEVKDRGAQRLLYGLVSSGADVTLRKMLTANPALLGTTQALWLVADDDVDMVVKGKVAPAESRLNETAQGFLAKLREAGAIRTAFNTTFFTAGDSREPEQAGVWGALVGSIYMMLVTLSLSFPLGVATAVYLEEFAPKNRWTDLIEVNINNLAAVPSIVFGLLGLAVFLNVFNLPRSSPFVGGMVLTLISLPTFIIAGRAALKAVPPSIRQAALGMGASRLQTVVHHVLPLAMPGILTGTIIGMAHAIGESAPLLMIGMVAFIVDVPGSPVDPATVLPVQVYLWADSPERAFEERTSATIMILLAFLALMNLAAILLRKKFERRW